jgi:hypothetical protein
MRARCLDCPKLRARDTPSPAAGLTSIDVRGIGQALGSQAAGAARPPEPGRDWSSLCEFMRRRLHGNGVKDTMAAMLA